MTISLCLLLAGCGPAVKVQTVETVRTEYVEVLRDTTVVLEVPKEIYVNATRDTSSHLESSLAESDACISGGILHHTLRHRDVKPEKVIQYRDIHHVRDSIIVEEKVVEVPRELTPWQRFWSRWGLPMLLALALAAFGPKIWRFVRRFVLPGSTGF